MMPRPSLDVRVKSLEETTSTLRQLPARVSALTERMEDVESQVLQLRGEMRGEFSAIRAALATRADKADVSALQAVVSTLATRDELHAAVSTLATRAELQSAVSTLVARDELHAVVSTLATKDELHAVVSTLATKDELYAALSLVATRDQLDELRRHMLVLHEDLIGRIKTMREGWPPTERPNDA